MAVNITNGAIVAKDPSGNTAVFRTLSDNDIAKIKQYFQDTDTLETNVESLQTSVQDIQESIVDLPDTFLQLVNIEAAPESADDVPYNTLVAYPAPEADDDQLTLVGEFNNFNLLEDETINDSTAEYLANGSFNIYNTGDLL